MGKVLLYFLNSLFFVFAIQLTSSCASRGFKLSQQMPGMDNKLNPVFVKSVAGGQRHSYIVANDGRVILKNNDTLRDEPSSNKRQVASSKESIRLKGLLYESPSSHFVKSTLDPENGAVLLGN